MGKKTQKVVAIKIALDLIIALNIKYIIKRQFNKK